MLPLSWMHLIETIHSSGNALKSCTEAIQLTQSQSLFELVQRRTNGLSLFRRECRASVS